MSSEGMKTSFSGFFKSNFVIRAFLRSTEVRGGYAQPLQGSENSGYSESQSAKKPGGLHNGIPADTGTQFYLIFKICSFIIYL